MYLTDEEKLPDFYPAVCEQDQMGRWIISMPDFPEFCVVGLAALPAAMEDARDHLAWAIRRRRSTNKLCPYPSSVSSLEGPDRLIALVAVTDSLPLAGSEEDG